MITSNRKSEMKIVNVNKGEKLTLVRHLKSPNEVCDMCFNVGQNAELKYIEIAYTRGEAKSKIEFNCERDSRLLVNTLDVDNVALLREQTYNLNGSGVDVNVVGLYTVGEGETCDNQLKMNHLQPNCSSKQIYKGVVGNYARFHGHIFIAKDAQQTVALQENHNLLLNDTAKVETQPWLEIYADDVKCNHGATIGKNDDEAVFYMRQRGISMNEAKKLLMKGFVEQCVVENDEKEEIFMIIENKIKTL